MLRVWLHPSPVTGPREFRVKRRMRPVPTVQWVVLAWTVCLEKIGFEFFCSVDQQCQGPVLKAFLFSRLRCRAPPLAPAPERQPLPEWAPVPCRLNWRMFLFSGANSKPLKFRGARGFHVLSFS